jgi:hypothetical protein
MRRLVWQNGSFIVAWQLVTVSSSDLKTIEMEYDSIHRPNKVVLKDSKPCQGSLQVRLNNVTPFGG